LVPEDRSLPQHMTRVVHFLLHVPKCAGTTVEAHFRTHLRERFLIAPRWESILRNFVGNRYPDLTADALRDVRVVSGHSLSTDMRELFPGAEIRESVLLRDPTGFLLSFYNYRWTRFEEGWGPEPPTFERWYSVQRRNPISRFLLNRYFGEAVPALYRLSSTQRLSYLEQCFSGFHFVGSYRQTDEMIGRISRELGIPGEVISHNVTPKRKLIAADLPVALRQRIERENALDQALFDRWGDRGWDGHIDAPRPDLPRADQLRYLVGDSVTGIAKKFIA
ncbi:MAG: hypothetical protein AAF479_18640, partial [Pseudomonadota bacterium]